MEIEAHQTSLYRYGTLPNVSSIRVLVLYPADLMIRASRVRLRYWRAYAIRLKLNRQLGSNFLLLGKFSVLSFHFVSKEWHISENYTECR
jgi:hypothetical protein